MREGLTERNEARNKIKQLHDELLAERLKQGHEMNEAIKLTVEDLRREVASPVYGLTVEQRKTFERIHNKHLAAMGEEYRRELVLDYVTWDEEIGRASCRERV